MVNDNGDRVLNLFTSGMDAETAARFGSPNPRHGVLRTVLGEKRCLRLLNPGGDPVAAGFSSSYPPLHAWLGAPIGSPTRIHGWLALIDKVGADAFSDEDERLAGILAGQVGRIYQNGSLYADVVRYAFELRLELNQRKGAEQESHNLLQAVIEGIPEIVYVKDREGRYLLANSEAARFIGKPAKEILGRDDTELLEPQTARRFMEVDRRVIESGKAETYEKVGQTAAAGNRAYLTTKAPFLGPTGAIRGVIGISRDITEQKKADEELKRQQEVLKALSRRLVEVQEEERRHLARELHDEIGQLLTCLKFALEISPAAPPETAQAKLAEARTLIEEAMNRVRELAFNLRPVLLDLLGLLPALRWLIGHYTSSTGIRVNFHQAGLEGRFAPELEIASYRIVQEALTNVIRHARVEEAVVRLWVDADTLTIQVEDQGVGFNPETALTAGRSAGLPGMQDRVLFLGGRFVVESTPGNGTHLLVQLPLAGHAGLKV
jgi:PAS domain S-box-containing protein